MRADRQVRRTEVHRIPVGALVEVRAADDVHGGVRLFVANHVRGRDGEPQYILAIDPLDVRTWHGGYSEGRLTVTRLPRTTRRAEAANAVPPVTAVLGAIWRHLKTNRPRHLQEYDLFASHQCDGDEGA